MSIAVAASLVDSALDLLAQAIMFWTERNVTLVTDTYPVGKTRYILYAYSPFCVSSIRTYVRSPRPLLCLVLSNTLQHTRFMLPRCFQELFWCRLPLHKQRTSLHKLATRPPFLKQTKNTCVFPLLTKKGLFSHSKRNKQAGTRGYNDSININGNVSIHSHSRIHYHLT